ncbi:hypothetical protein PMIN07_012389 [Paraphaeosphaeria minitans]
MTVAQLQQWIDMVAQCNDTVFESATAVAETYKACMLDLEPPEPLLLEMLSDENLAYCDLITGFQPASSQRLLGDVNDSYDG